MELEKAGSQPSTKALLEYFTGTVRIDPLFSPPDSASSPWQRKKEGKFSFCEQKEAKNFIRCSCLTA